MHVEEIIVKADSTMVFFKEISAHVILQLKKTATSLWLAYACSAWSPYTQVNINKLKMVQHCAAYFITGNYFYQASVTAMLAKLNLPSLAQRRDIMKLVTFHKIISQLRC